MIKTIIFAISLSISSSSFASPITFNYFAQHQDAPAIVVTGFVTIDTPLTSGIGNRFFDIVDYGFEWTNGSLTFSTGSNIEPLSNIFQLFNVDLDTNTVIAWGLCSGTCAPSHPEIIVTESEVDFTFNNTGGLLSNVADKTAWNQQWTAATVPEPSAIALMIFGLLGFVLRRRKFPKQVPVNLLRTNTACA